MYGGSIPPQALAYKGDKNDMEDIKMDNSKINYLVKLLRHEGMTDGEIESIVESVKSGELTMECIESQIPESAMVSRMA